MFPCIVYFARKNSVLLQIGYKTLSYELLEQNVAFGVEALFGNFSQLFSCLFVDISEMRTVLAILAKFMPASLPPSPYFI